MSLPWSLDGELVVAGNPDPAAVIRQLATALRAARATELDVAEHDVTFHAGIFRFVRRCDALVAVDRGRFTTDNVGGQTVVRYAGSLRQFLVVTAIVVTLVMAPFAVVGARWGGWLALAAVVLAWACLVGGNVLVAARLLPRWILRQAGDRG